MGSGFESTGQTGTSSFCPSGEQHSRERWSERTSQSAESYPDPLDFDHVCPGWMWTRFRTCHQESLTRVPAAAEFVPVRGRTRQLRCRLLAHATQEEGEIAAPQLRSALFV